ncbi:NUDIX domain-containing protein [Streptomyces sp. 3MP-14]|uniref:NUDIX domain-containing protein n=1 Tax=Streptomyces mimosae TaxID=2586635 RepID=A0A5N6ALA0_9ACTN|nr:MULTISPECIES: NUDIX domain-containing protein [Streptomyces]KAB8168846.1 NUDIX domain-containing protein [Streptomyces mimosae]KAB8177874.1 NUDIX domain-containing protein [Streptomyces sp. 3MP-14]
MGRRRRSARVLLVDDRDRLLLFRSEGENGAPTLWMTPGGGVRRLEPLPRAAARELWEETGLRVAPAALGERVAWTGGHADLGWLDGEFEDSFFFHRVAEHTVDASHWEAHEARTISEHRWWSVAELAATEEFVVPLGLVPLLTDLVAGRRPAAPVRLPWHH